MWWPGYVVAHAYVEQEIGEDRIVSVRRDSRKAAQEKIKKQKVNYALTKLSIPICERGKRKRQTVRLLPPLHAPSYLLCCESFFQMRIYMCIRLTKITVKNVQIQRSETKSLAQTSLEDTVQSNHETSELVSPKDTFSLP
uniref:PWWP domain-containing protein n=1 Tax=Trichogramma kaykai TaxID=54128 RepID=A0ABD2VRN3_9HYME